MTTLNLNLQQITTFLRVNTLNTGKDQFPYSNLNKSGKIDLISSNSYQEATIAGIEREIEYYEGKITNPQSQIIGKATEEQLQEVISTSQARIEQLFQELTEIEEQGFLAWAERMAVIYSTPWQER